MSILLGWPKNVPIQLKLRVENKLKSNFLAEYIPKINFDSLDFNPNYISHPSYTDPNVLEIIHNNEMPKTSDNPKFSARKSSRIKTKVGKKESKLKDKKHLSTTMVNSSESESDFKGLKLY